MSLFHRFSRIAGVDMMLGQAAAILLEVPVGLESEVSRLRRGDSEALAALLERYQHRLYRYLVRMVHETAVAEDLFQHTWLRVIEHIRRYDPRRSFEPWLFSVARNLAIDHLRRHRPESLDEPRPSGQTRQEDLAAAGPTALEMILARERVGLMARALAELPVIYQEVLTLRFDEEMKLEEIAEVLALPLSTVKSRLRRGLEGLRRSVGLHLSGEAEQG